jgi:hypothetical protein
MGVNTAIVVRVEAVTARLHLFGAQRRGFPALESQLPVPEDVLEHDDRVVHQHAHAEGEAAQAHDVERHTRASSSAKVTTTEIGMASAMAIG